MRRADREKTDKSFFDLVFSQAEEMFLAMNDGEYPYGVILNFAREDNRIYIHAAKEGKKLECIAGNPRVAFCVACDIAILREKSTTRYKSVFGLGKAVIVRDPAEKCHALDLLAIRYNAHCPLPTPETTADRVAIIRIDIEELSGKACEAGMAKPAKTGMGQ